MVQAGDIAVGMFVFTSDGEELGTVTRAGVQGFEVELRDGRGVLMLPESVAEQVTMGRLVLNVSADALERQHGGNLHERHEPAPADGGSTQISREAIERLWGRLPERSWGALHGLAHEQEDAGAGHALPADLRDLVTVADEMDASGAPFPRSAQQLWEVVERRAEAMPHDTARS